MSRLISLEVFNFQPHKRFSVEFDPFVTCLVGGNGRGKSSLIRAIKWVAFNRPLGDSVIRWGQDWARVRLVTEAGKFTREKGDGVNLYKFSGKVYKAFATGVPERISEVLQLLEVNFQGQIQAPFWLAQGAGEVAKEMNKVVDLDVIDRSMSFANSKVKETKGRVKVFKELAEDAEKRKKALTWVPRAERLLQEHDRIAQACAGVVRRLEGVSGVISQLREAQTTRQKLPDVSTIDTKIIDLRKVVARLEGLKRLVGELKCLREERQTTLTQIAAQEVEVERLKPELCPTCGQILPQTDRS